VYFSLLKRIVTYHVKIRGDFGGVERAAQRGGRREALPLEMRFGKTVGCDVCYEQTAASVGGKHGREAAL